MTIYPLDSVRNAPVRRDIEVMLESVRESILAHPWIDGTDGYRGSDVMEAFEASRNRLNVIGSMLSDLHGKHGADVGTGLGFATVTLRRVGLLVTATERELETGALAALGGGVLPYDIGRTPPPFPAESLDFVVFSEVLEHVNRSPVAVLRELAGLLRAGGRLILTTPNVARLAHIELLASGENFLEPFSEDVPFDEQATSVVEHVREYSVREVVEAIEAAGLGVDEVMMTNWGGPLHPNPYANDIIVARATK